MRTFETQLALNGIGVPIFPKEQKKFLQMISAAKGAYSMVVNAMDARELAWEQYRKKLANNWGYEFSKLSVIEEEPYFSFSTLEEAVTVFEKSIDNISDFSSLYHLYAKLNIQAHSKWIRQVIAEAPENCDLIIIRSSHFPNVDDIRNFNQQVAAHKPAVIEIYGYCPIWIAFRPNEKLRTQNWCIVKNQCTVKYLTKE